MGSPLVVIMDESFKPLREFSGHPRDVFRFLESQQKVGQQCAIAIVTAVNGPSAKEVGAVMAVSEGREYVGSVSNGCVDRDVAGHALECIKKNEIRHIKYGDGSPYFDIVLPCGGLIELLIVPNPELFAISKAAQLLSDRKPISVVINPNAQQRLSTYPMHERGVGGNYCYDYAPQLHISIAGRGEEAIALARLARAAFYDVSVCSPEDDVLEICEALGASVHRLHLTDRIPETPDDAWAAYVLLFHDHEWEKHLLTHAVEKNLFYIGAMGSQKTHKRRIETLRNAGISDESSSRICGPIGLIPSTRDAPKLAVSILAEIVSMYRSHVDV